MKFDKHFLYINVDIDLFDYQISPKGQAGDSHILCY